MSPSRVLASLQTFLSEPTANAGSLYNERSLQLELGYHLRLQGFRVEFERPFGASSPIDSTRRPKKNLDLFVSGQGETAAIELKVPLAKRHPETFYDFCADIEFVEAIVRAEKAMRGFCLMITNDQVFWEDSGRGSQIHDYFRRPGQILTGKVHKPTKPRDNAVVITGTYRPAETASTSLKVNTAYEFAGGVSSAR